MDITVEINPAIQTYVCTGCGYIYDPVMGDPERDIPPNTPFDDLPEDWVALPTRDDSESTSISPFLKEEATAAVSVRGSKFLMSIRALLQLVRVDGLIDDVRIYNYAISETVIKALYGDAEPDIAEK